MAEWNENPSWNSQDAINGGEQYSPNDTITPEDMNAFVENLQYLYQQGGDFEVNPHPVGSIYISTDSTSPAYLFGGAWTQIKDKFLLAAGSSYSAGSTGGEASHTLTVEEIPRHFHTQNVAASDGGWSRPQLNYGTESNEGVKTLGDTIYGTYSNTSPTYTGPAGNTRAHNNMPPYLAVYVWKRIS